MSTVTISNPPTEGLTQEFDDLFREHYPLVYRTAFSVIFNAQDAEDVVQTVFLRIFRNGLPAEVKNPKGYLYRAAVNEALNVARSRRNTQNVNRRGRHIPAPVLDVGPHCGRDGSTQTVRRGDAGSPLRTSL
jgi:DNA-directed RNA polymerase specialized sigma24 family protein